MLALANVREHWRSFAATFLAVTLGVALIAVTFIVYDSARPRVQPRLEGAAALVIPPTAVDADGGTSDRIPWSESTAAGLSQQLGAVDGVSSVVTDRNFYAQAFRNGEPVEDEAAEEAGHGWSGTRLAPYTITEGREPRTADEVAIDAALDVPVGSDLQINLAQGPKTFTVAGTVDGPGFFFTDEEAAELDPGVRAIGLVLDQNADVEAVAGQAGKIAEGQGSVVTGSERSVLEPQFIAHKRFLGTQLISAMAILGLFVTVFVVAATLALATEQRRREIGLLRTIGAEPRQIRRMVLGEATMIGVLGAVAGCLLGIVLAPGLKALLVGLEVTPPDFSIRISAFPLVIAAGIGAGVCVLGAWAASRTAARVSPLESLREASVEKRAITPARWIGGLAALGLGAVLAVMTAVVASDARTNLALFAAMALIVAATLLAPVIIGPVVRVVTAPFTRRSSGAGAMLVRAELLNATRRTASTAAPIIAAVGFAVLISGWVATSQVAYPASQAHELAGQVLIDPDGTPGLSDAVVQENPVGKASLPTRVFLERSGQDLVVMDALGTRDSRYDVPGETVLGETVAESLNAKAGQNLDIRFVDGRSEQFRVAAVLPDDPGRGDFLISREVVRSHDRAALTDTIFIPQEQAPEEVSAGAALHDAEEYALADYNTDARLTNSLAMMLIVVAVGYSGLAVANSMAMAAYGRRTDFQVMKSAGGTRRQLVGFAVGETVLVVSIAAALGLLVTIPPLIGIASGLSQVTSTSVGLHLSGPTLVATLFGSLLMATAASAAVTWRVIRPTTE